MSTAHIAAMIRTLPRFEPQTIKSGRWFVSVVTGNGPDSHVGDFETEAEAKHWILTKSEYWPGKPDAAVTRTSTVRKNPERSWMRLQRQGIEPVG